MRCRAEMGGRGCCMAVSRWRRDRNLLGNSLCCNDHYQRSCIYCSRRYPLEYLSIDQFCIHSFSIASRTTSIQSYAIKSIYMYQQSFIENIAHKQGRSPFHRHRTRRCDHPQAVMCTSTLQSCHDDPIVPNTTSSSTAESASVTHHQPQDLPKS